MEPKHLRCGRRQSSDLYHIYAGVPTVGASSNFRQCDNWTENFDSAIHLLPLEDLRFLQSIIYALMTSCLHVIVFLFRVLKRSLVTLRESREIH